MHPVQVEKSYKDGKIKYTYKDVKYDIDGWVDAKKYLPADYDLCLMKTKSRTLYGWYSGLSWDGMKIKDSDQILFWKRKQQE